MTSKPEEGPHVPDTVALLEAQAKEIADSKEWAAKVEDANDWLIERNRTLDARIAELEAALKKAADIATRYDGEPSNRQVIVMLSDLRDLRAALKGEKG